MRTKKFRPVIAAEDVAVVFNDVQVAKLAQAAKAPPNTNMTALAEEVREAARIFACDAKLLIGNQLHAEIDELHKAADRRRYEEVADRIGNLSPLAQDMLKEQGGWPIELPPLDALRDPARREDACELIARLCRFGGRLVDGRRRPLGKRSRPTWRPLLYAPEPRRQFPKRDVERDYVMWLQLAWLQATESRPARTADHRNPGPFARFARECLRLVGAGHADVVELINEVHRRRREMNERASLGLPK